MTAKKGAKAPRPTAEGVEAEEEAVDEAKRITEWTVRGEKVGRLAIGNVPLDEKEQVRRQVKASWFEVLGEAGVRMDVWNLTVFVWLARRASGEPDLLWSTFKASWDNTIRADEIDYEPVDPATDQEPDDPQL